MTDTIAHPPLPEPAAHMYPCDLEMLKSAERTATAFPVAVSSPSAKYGHSVPLYTAQQMREHCEAVALPLIKACRQAIYALRGREHDGFLRDAIKQATGEKP